MENNEVLPYQSVCLDEEVRTSIKLLQLGLGELQKINSENDFYHLPFLLLSSGLERLMKCMICLKTLEEDGRFPTFEEVVEGDRGRGHDLVFLKNKVISDCISEDTMSERPATVEDYEYITNNEDLDNLIEVLSKFGQHARYHNLDVVMGRDDPAPDAKQMWEDYESNMIEENDLSDLFLQPDTIDEGYENLNRIIIGKFERFVRALTRQFTLGDLGSEAEKFVAYIGPFLYLRDDEIGQTDYR